MSQVIIGSTAAVAQGTKRNWTFATGETSTHEWRGKASSVYSMYLLKKAQGNIIGDTDSLDYDPGRGCARLVQRIVADGPVIYELYTNDLYKDIRTHATFAALTAAQRKDVYAAYDSGAGVGASASWTSTMTDLYTFLTLGTEQYLLAQYVLRSTQTVSLRSSVRASYTGVNTVQEPPNTPAANVIIGNLPAGEWLKKGPMVRQYGARKWQIIQEFWHATTWSTILCAGTGTP